jgi:hypothetical protein
MPGENSLVKLFPRKGNVGISDHPSYETIRATASIVRFFFLIKWTHFMMLLVRFDVAPSEQC